MDARILVDGYVLQPVDDHDLLVGTLELDLTNNFEQAILDITGALANGYAVTLYPAHLRNRYQIEVEIETETETLHFNK